MTRDEIILLADALLDERGGSRMDSTDEVYEFAVVLGNRIVAAEREACAVIAEEWFCGCGRGKCPEGDLRAQDIANSIRARGQAS